MSDIFISICIPAYKRVEFLKRLLDSIAIQTFTDFEVILTDDSPTDDVKNLLTGYKHKFRLHYHQNRHALGTPENWNEAMRRANGQWIKLMHDDDWFSHKDSLGIFAKMAENNPGNFIFSSYTNFYFSTGKTKVIHPAGFRLKQLVRTPMTILSSNIIGPPSVTMHRNDQREQYDNKLKWLVDIDFYIRRLGFEQPVHIDTPLVHVGLGEDQVTMMCHLKPEIEIPENYYLLGKTGSHQLKNMIVYDAWWRLFRNLGIRNEAHLRQYGDVNWPGIILRILRDVGRSPMSLLRTGVVSKLLMSISYFKNTRQIR